MWAPAGKEGAQGLPTRLNTWALVLAGGEGTRLRALTTDASGACVPKQFCAFGDGRSLLAVTLARAARIAPPGRVLVSVLAQHRRFWAPELANLPARNVAVQPANRGTAAGILLPVLRLAREEPEAKLVVFPSDHFVRSESTLEAAVREALRFLDEAPSALILLGVRPERPDPGYGWMTTETTPRCRPARVTSFVEKPDAERAAALAATGGLVNSFIFAVRAGALLDLYRAGMPDVLAAFVALESGPGRREGALASLYESLAPADFSRHLLEPAAHRGALAAIAVSPACGWSDLGTPERLRDAWRRLGRRAPARHGAAAGGRLDLVGALRRAPVQRAAPAAS